MTQVLRSASIRVPTVIDIEDDEGLLDPLSLDPDRGLAAVVDHLVGLGHRRFFHIAGPQGWVSARNRELSYERALQAHGLTSLGTSYGDWSAGSGFECASRIPADLGVTALVVSNDQMALGALLALERSGVRVPADMSVTGFDDTPESAFYHPPLTTVEADFDRTGRAAFRRLLGLIEGGSRIARTDAPVRLIVRESTVPLGRESAATAADDLALLGRLWISPVTFLHNETVTVLVTGNRRAKVSSQPPKLAGGAKRRSPTHPMEAPRLTVPAASSSERPTTPSTTAIDRTVTDLDLMQEAGFTVIRVGESVWSTWEPRDDEFDLDWLQPVLDGAHERGISVILGTPTYAVPPWLQAAHPEIAAERRTGRPMPWGARQEVDYSHPAFLFHAERVIRAVVSPLRRPPRRDRISRSTTSPGMLLFHNRGAFRRFVGRLQGPVRRRRDPQPGVGADLLVAPAERLVGAVDARRQHAAAVRPRLAPLPGRPHDGVHRLAGRHRPRVRATGPVRHDVHRLPAAGDRRRGARRGLDVTVGQPVLRACRTISMLTKSLDSVTPWTTSGCRGCSARPTGCSRRTSRGSSSPRQTRSPSAVRSSTCRPIPGQLARRPSRSSRAARR